MKIELRLNNKKIRANFVDFSILPNGAGYFWKPNSLIPGLCIEHLKIGNINNHNNKVLIIGNGFTTKDGLSFQRVNVKIEVQND